ncbi:PAS domain S-box protein, partial [Rhizobium ruizarguesonis]
EEKELKLAHRRATDIYNLTPAMLFPLDEEDRITAVSDYWLLATGYNRAAVIGRNFADQRRAENVQHREDEDRNEDELFLLQAGKQ